jgi:transcriptional regulator with XRE-family HTH domain
MSEELRGVDLGERLRTLRERRELSPAQVAQRARLSQAELAAFESGKAVPAVGELVRLASALGVSMGHFFQRTPLERRVEVVRAQERWTVQPHSDAGRALNYRYQSLSYNLTDKLMSPFLIEIPPGQAGDVPPSSHEGEEFLFVLSGQLEVEIGDETHRLGPGDAIYFDSRTEHRLRASDRTPVRLVACVASAPARGRAESPLDRAFGERD